MGSRPGGEFTPFLRLDTEIRRIVRPANGFESVNARIRRVVKARGPFRTSRPR
ncbi:transposase [Streptomyces sp. NPDC007355]|uniref:transposase n=1 Tax=Streptomyces sp. NPDC007355 TaxID=3364778 RepID=UPI0036C0621E